MLKLSTLTIGVVFAEMMAVGTLEIGSGIPPFVRR